MYRKDKRRTAEMEISWRLGEREMGSLGGHENFLEWDSGDSLQNSDYIKYIELYALKQVNFKAGKLRISEAVNNTESKAQTRPAQSESWRKNPEIYKHPNRTLCNLQAQCKMKVWGPLLKNHSEFGDSGHRVLKTSMGPF